MKRTLSILFFVAVAGILYSPPSYSQKKTRIDILNADDLIYDRQTGENIKRLKGDVRLLHEDVYMSCDSAYLYDDKNEVDAFGNIHLTQGDTLHLYGDILKYKGESKFAEVRENVILIDRDTRLETNSIDFDIENNYGYYFNGGTIYNKDNTLRSRKGYYDSNYEIFYYKDSVSIVSPDYTILCDTMEYHSATQTAFFHSPTEIIGKDNYIYCESGWYNMEEEVSEFKVNAFIRTETQEIRGDSIYYDRGIGYGRILNNAEIIDTSEQVILRGDFAEYYEDPESSLITRKAQFIQYSNGDSLFMHADTLVSQTIIDTIGEYRLLKCYYGVRFYRSDLQGICDSLSYTFRDSVIHLYDNPVLWTNDNQLTSDSMDLIMVNRKMDRLEMYRSSFIISREDSSRYNQIKGKNMTGLFKDGVLNIIRVNGNGQTIYYAKEDERIVGVNKAESSNITIFVKNNEIEKIRLITSPDGTLNPPEYLPPSTLILDGFKWHQELRPTDKTDIFRKGKKVIREEIPAESLLQN